MPKLYLEIELSYPDHVHGTDPESEEWFKNEILMGNTLEDGKELVLHSNEIGDEIGLVRVIRIHN